MNQPKQNLQTELLDQLKSLAAENKLSGMMDIAAEIYHDKNCPGITSTQIKNLASKSPQHFKYLIDNPIDPTPEMKFGTQMHSVLFEPELFSERFIKYPNEPQYSGSGSGHARKKFKEANPNKEVIDQYDFDRMQGIIKSVYSHPIAASLLEGTKEKTFFWTDPETGLLCRSKPDNLSKKYKAIVDLKITRDASPDGWRRICANMGYHIQAAYYMDGLNLSKADLPRIEQFVFVCVESSAPYSIGIYHLDEASMELGRRKIKQALSLYQKCQKENRWPGYASEVQTLSMPQWIFQLEGVE